MYLSLSKASTTGALDKEYLMIMRDNFSYFSLKLYVVTPYLNRLDEMVQMKGHKIRFYADLTKIISLIIIIYSLLFSALTIIYLIYLIFMCK